MRIAYQAVLEPGEDSGFFIRFPDLGEAFTEGETEAEALFNAEEVLNLTLEGRIEEDLELPEPKEHEGGVWIYPSPQVQAALLVRFARRGRSLSDLARALGTSWSSAQRLESPKASPNLRQLQKAATALGQRLVLSFEPMEQ
jgi:antitoxin HicB